MVHRMDGSAWAQTERRGRVLAEEAVCGAKSGWLPDVRWLHSAAAWLAQEAPAWEELAAEGPARMDPARMEDGPGDRSYRLIASSLQFEAWLICWPAGGRLELHDHGGAPGALRVVRGSLLERHTALVADPDADDDEPGGDASDLMVRPVRERLLPAGEGVAFDRRYVHDVVNSHAALATSVHVYGAAKRAMRFYRLPAGRTGFPAGQPPRSDGADTLSAAPLLEATSPGA